MNKFPTNEKLLGFGSWGGFDGKWFSMSFSNEMELEDSFNMFSNDGKIIMKYHFISLFMFNLWMNIK